MNLGDLNGNNVFEINLCGEIVGVASDADVKTTVKKLLEERGIDQFVLIIDGAEVTSSAQIPATFDDCKSIEVRKYTKAG